MFRFGLLEVIQLGIDLAGAGFAVGREPPQYPLRKLPSTDRRFQNAERYIRQHRFNNHDWEDDWVSYDTRFELNLQSSAQLLLNRPSRQCVARTIDRAAGVRN